MYRIVLFVVLIVAVTGTVTLLGISSNRQVRQALDNVYEKGYAAHDADVPYDACPYSGDYRRSWLSGWVAARIERAKRQKSEKE